MGRMLGFFESLPFFRMGGRSWAFVGPVILTGVLCFWSDLSIPIRVSLIVAPDSLLQPLGRPVALTPAAVGCAARAPATGAHYLRAAPVLRRGRSHSIRDPRRRGSGQPDCRPQPDGGSGVCPLGHGHQSDIPHVLQRRYSTLPSPFTAVLHYGRQRSIHSYF